METKSSSRETFIVRARHPVFRDVELEFDIRDLKTHALTESTKKQKDEDDRQVSNGTRRISLQVLSNEI
jgi:hypothetical protein